MEEAQEEHPVVMRMQGLWPENIRGFEKHRKRDGGDTGHLDRSRSGLNQRLIGREDWAQFVHREIQRMRLANFDRDLTQLRKRRRTAEIERRLVEGAKVPWRPTRHGPLREVILTANAKWFEGVDGDPFEDGYETREEAFQRLAVAWLRKTFGDDCVHARADRDEKAYHIHAVILPRAIAKDGRMMLQPSQHPVIRNYEKGQDDVGAWFAAAGIGLKRGERRKEKVRKAIEHNTQLRKDQRRGRRLEEAEAPLPEYRQHVSPRKWREDQDCKLAARETEVRNREERVLEAECSVAECEKHADLKDREAGEVLAVAQAVADGDLTGLEQDQGPEGEQVPVPGRPALARRLFGKAINLLRTEQRAEARDEVTGAFEQIRRADDAIVRIANLLPMGLRQQVASARTSLSRAIMALGQIGGSRERDEPPRE
ncbi:plasmid recombination protein [Tranquillimonas rosea]|uniref:plasmid recombination protein n=1 Tax=Tranquillimonas rosea TaxID=641238 RepID=UPI003BA95EFF